MSMNAASSLYVHPELTDSEVWFKPRSSSLHASAASQSQDIRSSRAAVYAMLATVSLAAASAFTVVKLTSIGKLIQDSPYVQRWL